MSRTNLHYLLAGLLVVTGATTVQAHGEPSLALAQARQPEAPLTLEQAIRVALDHNLQLAAADARQGAAEATVQEARARQLPRLGLSADYTRTTNPVLVFGNLLRQERFGPENFAIDALNTPGALGNWNTTLSLVQPLWTGGAISGAVTASERELEAMNLSIDRTRQEVTHQVVQAYANAVLACYQLEVAEEVAVTAGAHEQLVSDLRQAGVALESDLLQAKLQRSEAEEIVVLSESAIEISQAALNLAMGRDLATPIALPDAIELTSRASGALPAVEELVTEAIARRPDLRAALRRVAAAELLIDVAGAGSRPQVGIQAAAEANSGALLNRYGTNWTVMIGGRWNLFDGSATGAQVARARHQADEARAQSDLLVQTVALQVRRAWSERRAGTQRLGQALLAVEMATASLRTVEDRYRGGLITLVELLDAQTMLTRSRAREISARRDLLVAQTALDLATGADRTHEPGESS